MGDSGYFSGLMYASGYSLHFFALFDVHSGGN
ncbi:hypothetical protein J2741_002285 [Methanolinea mesophila]|nr:hypothetical protein [Methanolinea mesophila]